MDVLHAIYWLGALATIVWVARFGAFGFFMLVTTGFVWPIFWIFMLTHQSEEDDQDRCPTCGQGYLQ